MSSGILCGRFDPITAQELAYIRQLRRKRNWDRLIVQPDEEGILPAAQRLELLRRALSPYRRLSACPSERAEGGLRLPAAMEEGEAEVRGGRYDKAAPGIRRILAESGIYLEETVRSLCRPRRAEHSLSVAKVCMTLARAHHLDVHRAWLMGCMHDLTKAMSDEEGRKLLAVYEPDKVGLDPKVYHSFTAPIYLRQKMGVTDPVILGAIRAHTLGTCRNDYDRILYIADKIEPTRGYDVTEEMNLSLADLRAAFDLVYREAEAYRERNTNG